MDKVNGKLTVYFEEPFWIGVFERIEDGKLSVAKVTFGAEPKDYEVQEYIQKHYASLKFSPAVDAVVKDIKRNPKRMQREARRQMQETGIGTKSQQALKLQQKQNKQECKIRSREKKEGLSDRFSETDRNKRNFKQNGAGLSGCAGRYTGSRSSGWDAMPGMWFCSSSKAYADSEGSSHRRTAEKTEKVNRGCRKSGI